MTTRLHGRSMLAAIAASRRSARKIARWLAEGPHRPLIVLVITVVLAYGIAALLPGEAPSDHGGMPTVAMMKLDGGATTTDAWLGHPLVVNIWATWCPPCRVEMPSLERLGKKLAPDDIRVVALSVDEDQHLVREFMLKYGIDLPVGIAASPSEAMRALGVVGLPLTLYVDADGRIVERYVGERDWGDEAVAREVRKKLLAR